MNIIADKYIFCHHWWAKLLETQALNCRWYSLILWECTKRMISPKVSHAFILRVMADDLKRWQCCRKKDGTPLLTLWSYVFLALTHRHYNYVIMGVIASQITSLTIVFSTVHSKRRSKKTSTLRVTGLCAENSPVTGEFPAQRASNAENVLMTSSWIFAPFPQIIFAYTFTPVAFMLGIPWEETNTVASILGLKLTINEILAYFDLGSLRRSGQLSVSTGLSAGFVLYLWPLLQMLINFNPGMDK